MDRERKAVVYAVSAVLFWSTVATAFKIALKHVTLFQLLTFSSLVSFLLLTCILLIKGKFLLLFSFRAKDYAKSACLGFLNPFLYYLVLFLAYSRLLGQQALVLNYTWPITLVLLSALIQRKRIGVKTLAALGLSFLGVVLVAMKKGTIAFTFSDPLGVGLAVGSSLIWSVFWILNVRDPREEVVKLALSFFFGSIYSSILLVFRGGGTFPNLPGIAAVVYVGFFEMGLTFVLWLRALRLSSSTPLISNLVFLSPFISLFLLHFIVGEDLAPVTFIGLVLIIGGILLQRLGKGLRRDDSGVVDKPQRPG